VSKRSISDSICLPRYLLGADRDSLVVSFTARLIYEAVLLPHLIEQSGRLQRVQISSWTPESGDEDTRAAAIKEVIVRNKAGVQLYNDGTSARRLKASGIKNLAPLCFLGHSSGVITMQQMDNVMRKDLALLGYSHGEQVTIFNRNVIVSFGSAGDINLDLLGTPTVDVTAYNDIRSLAGTTSEDYLVDDSYRRKQVEAMVTKGANYRYAESKWKLIRERKVVLRLIDTFLREDPARIHDGHSIKRYCRQSFLLSTRVRFGCEEGACISFTVTEHHTNASCSGGSSGAC